MQLEKVRSYPVPRYPTAVQFHQQDSLTRYMPRRWRGNRLVGQVLIFTAMTGLCSCSLSGTRPENTEPVSVTESAETPWYLRMFGGGEDVPGGEASGETAEKGLTIPLFVHGNGRGSYGCDSVLPPVYLSEDEAAQVIRETALEYGVDFSGGNHTLESDRLPYTNLYGDDTEETYKGSLTLDGYDKTLGIGFEYVSQKDVSSWHKDTGVYRTVESFNMKGTAEKLTEAVRDTAVFYDPGMNYDEMPDWNSTEDWAEAVEEYTEIQKARMKEDLRAQVKDFIDWLVGQGVL